MIVSLIRTVVLYIAVMIALRLMGKRQIGELQPTELVITIILGDLASVPMQNTDIPLLNGITPIITLVFIEVMLSIVSLKNRKARRFISGSPSIVIRNGIINENELRKMRFNLDDLIEELRNKDIIDINDVEMAVVDTNGEICIMLRPDKKPLTAGDMGIGAEEEMLPYILISDGRIISDNLKKISKSEKWLLEQLKKKGYSPRAILLCTYTEKEGIKLQIKGE